jgi:tetratricopeptide (TPR) repeat protein
MKRDSIQMIAGTLLLLAGICAVSTLAAAQGSNDPKQKPKEDPLIADAVKALQNNKIDESRKKYDEAVKNNPELPPFEVWLAQIQYSSKKPSEGRQLMEIALLKYGDNPQVYQANGLIALGEGRITEAKFNFQTALQYAESARFLGAQRKSFKKDANAGLALAYEKQGAWEMARKHLESWAEFDPKNAQVQERLARALFNTGNEKEALAALKEAQKIQQTSKDADPATVNSELDTPEVIMAVYQSAKVEAGKDAAETKQKKEANEKKTIDDFEKAISLYKTKARPYLQYGDWLLNKGRVEQAKAQILQGVKLEADTTDKSILRQKTVLLGLLARYEKDYPAAEKQFNSLFAADPNDGFAANQLALSLIEQVNDKEKQKRAVAYAEHNAGLNQQNAEARATLGWCYFRSGRIDDAENQLKTAVSGGQATPDTVYYLAKLLAYREKYDDAYPQLKKALVIEAPFVNKEDAKTFFTKEVEVKATKEIKEKVAKEEKDAETVTPKKEDGKKEDGKKEDGKKEGAGKQQP